VRGAEVAALGAERSVCEGRADAGDGLGEGTQHEVGWEAEDAEAVAGELTIPAGVGALSIGVVGAIDFYDEGYAAGVKVDDETSKGDLAAEGDSQFCGAEFLPEGGFALRGHVALGTGECSETGATGTMHGDLLGRRALCRTDALSGAARVTTANTATMKIPQEFTGPLAREVRRWRQSGTTSAGRGHRSAPVVMHAWP